MTPMKITFNDSAVEAAQKIAENTGEKISRGISRLTEQAPDSYYPLRKTIIPFYNKFLPKFLRRTTNVEFWPNTQVIKSKNVYNNENQIIKSQLFDEAGNETYFEKFNPKTQYSFTRTKSEGKTIEQEMRGSILLRREEKDADGFVTYKMTFNPKTNITRKEEYTEDMIKIRETIGKKEIFRYEKNANGENKEVITDFQTSKKFIIERSFINYSEKETVRKPLFSKLTIQNNDGTKSTFEYERGKGYKYSVFDKEDYQVNSDEQYISKKRMLKILGQIAHKYI